MRVYGIGVEQFAGGRRDDAVVLDVGSAEEFAGGHVPGGVNVPLEQVGAGPGRCTGREVYVICQFGGRSAMAAQVLAGAGAGAVSVAGGTVGWVEAGRPGRERLVSGTARGQEGVCCDRCRGDRDLVAGGPQLFGV